MRRNMLILMCFVSSIPALGQNRYQSPTDKDAANAAISQFIATQPPTAGTTTVIPMGIDSGINTITSSDGSSYSSITTFGVTNITTNTGKPVTTCITSPFGVTTCQ